MFTGIVQRVAPVTAAEREPKPPGGAGPEHPEYPKHKEALRVRIRTGFEDLEDGESVAVNGVCLTVAERHAGGEATFYLSAETLARSSLGALRAGSRVNLERALLPSTRLSGHLVQGHVDGLGRWISARTEGESHLVEIDLPPGLSKYCVEKGSIALNGVSLTINSIVGSRVSITLIPHTWTHTQFPELRPGDPVNVEVDVLAKYVEKLLVARKPPEVN